MRDCALMMVTEVTAVQAAFFSMLVESIDKLLLGFKSRHSTLH